MFLSTLDSLLEAGALADDPTNTVDGWQAYCDWSEAVGQDFEIPEPTPTPARRFAPGEVMPWDAPATCPACGDALEADAPICARCLADSTVLDDECMTCGASGADAFTALCVPCANEFYDEMNARDERALHEQRYH